MRAAEQLRSKTLPHLRWEPEIRSPCVYLSAAAHSSPGRELHSAVASQPSSLGLLPPQGSATGASLVLHPLLMMMTCPERSMGQGLRTEVTSLCNWPAGHLCPETLSGLPQHSHPMRSRHRSHLLQGGALWPPRVVEKGTTKRVRDASRQIRRHRVLTRFWRCRTGNAQKVSHPRGLPPSSPLFSGSSSTENQLGTSATTPFLNNRLPRHA